MPNRFSLTMVLVCLAVSLSFGGAVLAQEYRAVIQGQITDPSGAAIPAAKISITNAETGVTLETQSNEVGKYLLPAVDPGVYTLAVEADGFKRYVRKGLQPRIGQTLELNIVLELGQLAEQITVTGETPLLDTSNADVTQVVEQRYLDKLYIPGRNPINLLTLAPGVVRQSGKDRSFSSSGQNWDLSINGGGSSGGSNEVVVDGVSVTMPRQRGALATTPSADTMAEYKVYTTMFDASLGRTNGGTVVIATKGGTNEFHGSFEAFFRDKVLDANSWSNNKAGKERPDTDRAFVLGTVGGPIIKNKTFFFVSYERERINNPLSHQSRVPTELERNGDFSQTLSPSGGPLAIYDPFSTTVVGGTATRDPFPGSVIPASRFDPAGHAIINVWPAPNLDVPAQIGVVNFRTTGVSRAIAYQWNARVDQQLSDRQRLFGRFGFMKKDDKGGNPPPGLRIWSGGLQKFYSAAINHDITFSPATLLTVRYGWVRYWNTQIYDANRRDPAELKIPEVILQHSLNKAWPYVTMKEGIQTLGGRVKERANDVFSIVPSMTKLIGQHSFRFGADLRLTLWNSNEVGSYGAGRFDFRNQFTRSDPFRSSTGKTSGTSMASLLLGTLQDSSRLSGNSPYSMSSYYTAFYVQDDWKVTPKLTLNLGLRYEIESPWKERYNRLWYGFDRDAKFPIAVPGMDLRGGGLFAGVDGNPEREGETDFSNFGPRFGFAYRLTEKTVIRGGYGLFYSSNLYNVSNSNPIPATFALSAPIIGSVDGHATPFATLQDPFPNGITLPPGNSERMAARAGDSIRFQNQTRVLPYTQQWQIGVQRQLTSTMSFEVAFMRTLTLKSIGGPTVGYTRFDLNDKPDVYLQFGSEENKKVPNPFYGIFPSSSPLGASKTIRQRQLWLRFPQFTSVYVGENGKTANYHAMILKFEKRFSHGLSMLFNYNWSKLIEDNRVSLVNPRPFYRGVSGFDRPHLLNVAFVYDLPFGKGRRFLSGAGRALDALVGGWTVSGRFNYTSGQPLTVTDSNGRPIRIKNPHIGGSIHSRLGDKRDANGNVLNPYFDITAFQSLPNQYTIPPEAPFYAGEIRAPQRTQLDMAVMKSFRVWKERVRVDVRGEAQNFTNTPTFADVGTNMANRGTFSVVQRGGNPRTVQLAVRAVF